MSKPSKAALRVQKQIAKWTDNPVHIDGAGSRIEEVRSVIHEHRIEVMVQDGRVTSHHVCGVGLHSDSATDYFPGMWCDSLSQAIRLCLPRRHRNWEDAHGVIGRITVNLHYSGAGFKVTWYEIAQLLQLRDESLVWEQPNFAANRVYKLRHSLGMDVTGHAGF